MKVAMCKERIVPFTGTVIRQLDIVLSNAEARRNPRIDEFVEKVENLLTNGLKLEPLRGVGIRTIHINEIEKIVVVVFDDDTKQIVKCSPNDEFDPEIGFSLAITRKLLGSKTQVRKFVSKHAKVISLPEEKVEPKPVAKKRSRPAKKGKSK